MKHDKPTGADKQNRHAAPENLPPGNPPGAKENAPAAAGQEASARVPTSLPQAAAPAAPEKTPPKSRGKWVQMWQQICRKRQYRQRRKKTGKNQVVRIEELEAALAHADSDIDPETVVSLYMPHRRAKRLAAALLQVDKLQLLLLGMLLAVAVLFIMAFMQEKMGNFTINLNRLELYRRGISIAETGNFDNPTARLTASTVQDATNVSAADLPDDLDAAEGDHSGKNYMAYTYYVRNAGKEDVGYVAAIRLEAAAKGAEQAVRVAVWRNGERVDYAAPAANGSAEPDTTPFLSAQTVCEYHVEEFRVGDVDKYTVVIWLEGDDPECVDRIVGGSVEFSMNIDAEFTDDTSLLVKFIRDIVDTLTGDRPIDAAGNDAPDYYNVDDVTYANRRNQ